MLDKTKVMVMNQSTWNNISEQIMEKAENSDNPTGYIGMLGGIDIIIDNELLDNYVEVYERWLYESVLKFGRMKKYDE